DSDPDPRLPARGPPRRTNARGRMTELETHVGTQGEAPEEVGYRNKLRARWRALPLEQQWAATIVIQVGIALLLGLLSFSLTYATLFIFALMWLRKLPELPWRLGAQVALIA